MNWKQAGLNRFTTQSRLQNQPSHRSILDLRGTLIRGSALLGINQNGAAPMIIDNSPFFDLFQGSKTPQASKVVVQAAISCAWRLSGALDITHGRCSITRFGF
jgi:hypothetical protein